MSVGVLGTPPLDGRGPATTSADESRLRRFARAANRLQRRPHVRQLALALGCLVVLELVVFGGYLTGTAIPAPDDFISYRNNEPWAWWRDLSASGPQDWVPYAWGGYPSAVSLENGSWYLPIGLASLFAPYTIHAAAVLQALTVGAGALGVYALGRTWRLHHLAALLGLVAYFFAVGAYSNALHPGIVRGFAFAPWVVLCLSPRFPWRRWWAVPAAALVLWQAAVGSYVGVTVALGYGCIAMVLAFQLTGRHPVREYLRPAGLALAGAVLLSVPKFLPALRLHAEGTLAAQDGSVFSNGMLGTLFYPYDYPWLPDDLSMRSFFVVAPCWVLLVLLRRRSAHLVPVVALGGTALLLGVPRWPWWDATAHLPGLSLSPFRMADFRVPLVVAVVVASMIAMSAALRSPAAIDRRGRVVRLALLAGIVAVAAVLGVVGDYPAGAWVRPWIILTASALLVAILGALTGRPLSTRFSMERVAASGLVVLAAVSGVSWAFATTLPWRQERAPIENEAWGTTSGDLITQFDQPMTQRRLPRTPLDDAAALPTDVHWNSSFYTGQDAVGGYVDLAGAPAFTEAFLATTSTDPTTYLSSRSLLAAPGLGIAVSGDRALPTQADVERCATTGACGRGLLVEPVAYQAGNLSYLVHSEGPVHLLFNEAYYPGWRVEACRPATRYCRDLPVRLGGAGMVLTDLPVGGAWNVSLTYQTPGKRADALAFALGAALVLVPVAVRLARRRATAS